MKVLLPALLLMVSAIVPANLHVDAPGMSHPPSHATASMGTSPSSTLGRSVSGTPAPRDYALLAGGLLLVGVLAQRHERRH